MTHARCLVVTDDGDYDRALAPFDFEGPGAEAHWDWYVLGGRYTERALVTADGTMVLQCRRAELNVEATGPCFAVLTSSGEWHENPDAWGEGLPEGKTWPETFAKLVLAESPDAILSLVDVHS